MLQASKDLLDAGKPLSADQIADRQALRDCIPWLRNIIRQLNDALIKANKDFDLLLLPNRRHGFGNEPYMMRRRWDYFVKNLMGAEPPIGYEIGAPNPLVP